MTGLVITGWGALTSAGIGAGALARRLASAAATAHPGTDVSDIYDEPLPAPSGHALTDFDVRALLGRKGTSTYDRATALAVVSCREALEHAGTAIDDTTRTRVGVVLGTTLGSFKSTSDYSRETLVQERPYLVNPLLFPNTVMNCAAGQVAIRYGLRGVNATIAGGALAFLNAVRYAGNVIDRGYADVMLTGAAEEFTPHRAWATHLASGRSGASDTEGWRAGEAAGVFVLTRPEAPGWAGSRVAGRIRAVATGYGPDGDAGGDALAGCIDRAVRRAGVDPAAVRVAYTSETDEQDRREYGPTVRVLGHEPKRVPVKRYFGECDAASGAVGLAMALTVGEPGTGLLTARGADGAVGAAIVEGVADDGADRG